MATIQTNTDVLTSSGMPTIQTNTDVSMTSSIPSSVIATATTSGSSAPTPSLCGAITYDIPVKEAACAIPGTSKKDSMKKCCKTEVETYDNDCAMYCLVADQLVKDLVNCLTDEGIKDGQVFCNEDMTATGTAEPTATQTGGGDDDDDDKDDEDDKDGEDSPTGTDGSDAPEETDNAAATYTQSVSKTALGVAFTLFFSTFASFALA